MSNNLTIIDKTAPIFWRGKECKQIKWDSLNLGGKIRIKIDKAFISVDISELSNNH